MPDFLTTFGVGAGGGVGLAGGIYLFKWVLEWGAGRLDKRTEVLDAGTQKLIQNLQQQITALSDREKVREQRIDRLESELEDARRQLAECMKHHAQKDGEIAELKGLVKAQGSMRQEAQVLIAADKIAQKGRAL